MSNDDFQAQVLEQLASLQLTVKGEDKVNGDPGLLGEVRAIKSDVAALKASNNATSNRAWAFGLGALSGTLAGWFKTAFQ